MHVIQEVGTKAQAYEAATGDLVHILEGETDLVLKMSTVSALLKQYLPHFFWVGFYRVHGQKPELLVVGPYQGTMGCLYIPFSKGVCGRAARLQSTQIVADVHADPEHIACDSRSRSEIVVPVFDAQKRLIAVLDVDSESPNSFDETDRLYLEKLMQCIFS